MHWDITELIIEFSYLAIFAIVFAESGLLVGFFLPGDSLLFTAGFLASQGYLSLPHLIAICIVAAILGDAVGFLFGHKFGRRCFDRPDSKWFKRKHLAATEAFYEKHGGKTIVMARFIPIIRTFAPIVAGISNMGYRRFVSFNILGGVLWGAGLPLLGYVLGHIIPDIDAYLLPTIFLIVLISLLPTLVHLARSQKFT